MSEFVVTLTRVGVNMGDHGQDVTTAHAIRQGESVAEMVDRLLVKQSPYSRIDYDHFLTIRLVKPDEDETPDALS